MLLVSNVFLFCFIVLTEINENAADRESRTNTNKHNTKENREVLKKLVEFLNNSERTNANSEEPTVVSVIDGIDIQNPDEMRTVMKHLQKNYDYELIAELTHNKPRMHVIRNPDVLDDFVDTLQKEESLYTHVPDILKSTVRRYGDFGFGQAISAENFGKRNKNLKRNKYSYESNYNNKKRSIYNSREKNYKRTNNNKRPFYINEENNYNRQTYGSREKFSKRDEYHSRDRFDSREKYNKNNYNKNKARDYNKYRENSYNSDKYTSNGARNKYESRSIYDTRNKFDHQVKDKTSFRTNKIASRIRSRDEDEKGLDIPENPSDNYYPAKKASKDWLDGYEQRKKVVNTENDWGHSPVKLSDNNDWSNSPAKLSDKNDWSYSAGKLSNNNDWNNAPVKLSDNNDWSNSAVKLSINNDWSNSPAKLYNNNEWSHSAGKLSNNNDWSEVGIEKTTERNYNDWSQVGVDKSKVKNKEWSNVAIDPPSKDRAEASVAQKSSSKRYYNDEDFTLRKEVDDITTQFAPAYTEKRKNDTPLPTNDWDQPIKHYENKYKDKMDKLYTSEHKRQKSDSRSDIGYHPFGRTPIPFVGKRVLYADN